MPDSAADLRRQRLWLLGASAFVVAAVVVIAIAIGTSGGDEAGTTTGPPEGVAATRALFAGIPQEGRVLGAPKAQVRVLEFADVQCPYCGESAREELPDVVRKYVRTGKVRLEFVMLGFLGKDSVRGALMAAAAARQNKLWQFVDLVYRNQGSENAGWVTDAYLRRVAAAAGLDVAKAFADRRAGAARAALGEARYIADGFDVESTPSFVVMRRGVGPVRVDGTGKLEDAIEDALHPGK